MITGGRRGAIELLSQTISVNWGGRALQLNLLVLTVTRMGIYNYLV